MMMSNMVKALAVAPRCPAASEHEPLRPQLV
jgi:hypothetical protein